VRITPLSRVAPEGQLLCQLVVSAPLLLLMAPAFGVLLRDPGAAHWAGLAFQSIAVASLGFLAWFQLLKIYKASGVASFAFLAPVLAVIFGWLILDEAIAPQVWAALVLVAAGIYLINRK
jgi:drug/metabolite transporter (DMT)-like permease